MGDLNINRDMYRTLFQNGNTEYRLQQMIKDGKIDGSDKKLMSDLRNELEKVANLDGVVDKDEDALIDAMDSRGLFGTNEEMVYQNMKNILATVQKLKSTPGSSSNSPNALNFEVSLKTQNGLLGSVGLNSQERMLKVQDFSAPQTPEDGLVQELDSQSAVSTDGQVQVSDLSRGFVRSTDPAALETELLEQTHQSALEQSHQAGLALKDQLAPIHALLSDTQKVGSEQLAQDLKRFGTDDFEDMSYARTVLRASGVPQEILHQTDAKLKAFLQGPDFDNYLSQNPETTEKYRTFIVDKIENYQREGTDTQLAELKKTLYDNSYIFEDSKALGESAYGEYYQLKQNLLQANQANNLLQQVQNNTLPDSVQDLNQSIGRSDINTRNNIATLTMQTERLISKVEANPTAYASPDLDRLKSLTAELQSPDAKRPSLDTLNELWAELEKVGLQGGLGDDFEAFDNAVQSLKKTDPASLKNPMIKEMLTSPKIAEAAPDLIKNAQALEMLNKPENKPLLDAILSGDQTQINRYYQQYFDGMFTIDYGSITNFSDGFFGDFKLDSSSCSASASPAFSVGSADPLGDILGTSTQLGFSAVNLACATPQANGKNMSLWSVSKENALELAKLVKDNPELKAFIQANGAELNTTIKQSDGLSDVQAVLQAKQDFDTIFWGDNSSLEKAQNQAQNSDVAKALAQKSLDQAGIALEIALKESVSDDGTRVILESLQQKVTEAKQELNSKGTLTDSQELNAILKAVSDNQKIPGARLSEQMKSIATLQKMGVNPTEVMQKLRETLKDTAQTEKLLAMLPEKEKALLQDALKDKGELFVASYEKILNLPGVSAEQKMQLLIPLREMQNMVSLAQKEGMTPAAFQSEVSALHDVPHRPGEAPTGIKSSALKSFEAALLGAALIDNVSRRGGDDILREMQPIIEDSMSYALKYNLQSDGTVDQQALFRSIEWRTNMLVDSKAYETQEKIKASSENLTTGLQNQALQATLKDMLLEVGLDTLSQDQSPITFTQLDALSPSEQQTLIKALDSKIKQLGNSLTFRNASIENQITSLDDLKYLLQQKSQGNIQGFNASAVTAGAPSVAGISPSLGIDAKDLRFTPGSPAAQANTAVAEAAGDLGRMETAANKNIDLHRPVEQANQVLKQSVMDSGTYMLQQKLGIDTGNTALMRSLGSHYAQLLSGSTPEQRREFWRNSQQVGMPALSNTDCDQLDMAMAAAIFAKNVDPSNPGGAAALAVFSHLVEHPPAAGVAFNLSEFNIALSSLSKGTMNLEDFSKQAIRHFPGTYGEGLVSVAESFYTPGLASKNINASFTPASTNTPADQLVNIAVTGGSQTVSTGGAGGTSGTGLVVGQTGLSTPGSDHTPGRLAAKGAEAFIEGVVETFDKGSIGTGSTGTDHVGSDVSVTSADISFDMLAASLDASLTPYLSAPPEHQSKVAEGLSDLTEALNINLGKITEANQTYVAKATPVAQEYQEAKRDYEKHITALNKILETHPGLFEEMAKAYQDPAYIPKAEFLRAEGSADQKASQLVSEANQLARRLVLAPVGQDSNADLTGLVNDFINIIRDQDYKTRQLLMAQLANQMMTDSITNFYKDKTDKNNLYHQASLDRMAASFQNSIEQGLQKSLINATSGDSQSIAAISGQVGAAHTAEAMGVEQLRETAAQMLSEAQKMEPPLLTDLQKERILDSLFDRNPDNDVLGIMALAGLQSLN